HPRCSGSACESQDGIGERVGNMTRGSTAYYLFCETPEILDKHNAQRNRNRPQFSDRQRLYALIRPYEPPQRFRIEPAVSMGDERPDEPVDTRIALKRPVG